MAITTVLFDWRIFLVLLILVAAIALYGTWQNSANYNGIGSPQYPNADCGHNWFFFQWLPGNGNCLRGATSDEKMDEQLRRSGAYDSTPAESCELVCQVLKRWEWLWTNGK